jgi:hypothetical protein
MNLPEDDIEALLARLSPAAPDEALLARLHAARPRPSRGRIILYLGVPLAAAAGIAFALIPHEEPPAIPEPQAVEQEHAELKPLGSLQHLIEVADLGVIQGANDMPLRLVRTRWIDEIYYESPGGGEPVKEGRVREEVMPVSMPVY